MKKSLPIIIFATVLVIIGGLYFFQQNKQESLVSVKNSVGSFLNIEDALNQKLSLYCEFDEAGYPVKSYIKNGAVRVSSDSGEMIMIDNKMYIWDTKTMQGIIYNIVQDNDQETGNTLPESLGGQNYLEMLNQYKESCNVMMVDDSNFELPKDIKFEDVSKFLEDINSQSPKINPQNQ